MFRHKYNIKNLKFFASHEAHRTALISISLATSHQLTQLDYRYRTTASYGVPVYIPAFAGTHWTYPRKDGQAELTWVAWL